MHDIDRVRLETQSEQEMPETGPFEAEQFEFGEAEGLFPGEMGEVFGEAEQMEFATRLLEVTNEAELDRFLGALIKRAGQAAGRFIRSPEGKAIGGLLKGAAKQVLPAIGSQVGGYLGGARGATLGADAARLATKAFGLEVEGLSGEDREFEIARRFVTFAGRAVRNLAVAPGADPRSAAHAAAVAAARTLAPGLLRPSQNRAYDRGMALPSSQSGRWIRRGNKIVLYGI